MSIVSPPSPFALRHLAPAALGVALALQGCINVETRRVDPWSSYATTWSNALATGEPSSQTREIVAMLELEAICRVDFGRCADAVAASGSAVLGASRFLAVAELDYLAAREGDATRFWHCTESAYRVLADGDPGETAFVAAGALSLATSLYNACLDRALAPATATAVAATTTARIGRYRIAIEWPASLAAGASLRSAAQIDVGGFRNRQVQPGVGAPYVHVPAPDGGGGSLLTPPGGLVVPLTAIARFGPFATPGEPVDVAVRFADPYAEEQVRFGDNSTPLAADYTAAFALMAVALGAGDDRLQRLLRPGIQSDLPEMYAVTPYEPDRTIVVMLHGLGSGPLAWLDLTNDLLGDPRLRSKIQIWHCRYASGFPLLYNRREIAARLDGVRRVVDPGLDDRATRDIVLVGHSMGGVLSRLLVSSSGDALWREAFPGDTDSLAGDPADIAAARELFRFEPLPAVRRAVFIAAPQRGAPSAAGAPGRLLRSLITLPPATFGFLARLARDNPEVVNPLLRESYLAGGPLSVDVLSPDHPIIRAAVDLPIAADVPVHVVSGTGWPLGSEPSDGWVPVSSTLVPGAASTLLVDSTHDVQRNPLAILEIKRILREHVGAGGSRRAPRDTGVEPPAGGGSEIEQ